MKTTTKSPGIFSKIYLLGLIMLCFFYSCNKNLLSDESETSASEFSALQPEHAISTASTPFSASVGAPIEVSVGNKWIENFKKQNGGQGKEYQISVNDLKAILSDTDCVGVCLYFALDEKNNFHILPIGVNVKGQLMKAEFINTMNGPIDWETSQKWIGNEPGDIDARFFGRNTFSRLFRDANCKNIKAFHALDDQYKPQLLLGNAAVDYSRPTIINDSSFKYEDASAVCPPICPVAD